MTSPLLIRIFRCADIWKRNIHIRINNRCTILRHLIRVLKTRYLCLSRIDISRILCIHMRRCIVGWNIALMYLLRNHLTRVFIINFLPSMKLIRIIYRMKLLKIIYSLFVRIQPFIYITTFRTILTINFTHILQCKS